MAERGDPFLALELCSDEGLGIHDAALLEGDPNAELARLRSGGYRYGRVRRYVTPSGHAVVVTAYRFSGSRAAALYRDDGRDHLLAQAFPVREVGDGFVTTVPDGKGFTGHVASLARGDWHVAVIVDVGSGLSPLDALRLGRAQLGTGASG